MDKKNCDNPNGAFSIRTQHVNKQEVKSSAAFFFLFLLKVNKNHPHCESRDLKTRLLARQMARKRRDAKASPLPPRRAEDVYRDQVASENSPQGQVSTTGSRSRQNKSPASRTITSGTAAAAATTKKCRRELFFCRRHKTSTQSDKF